MTPQTLRLYASLIEKGYKDKRTIARVLRTAAAAIEQHANDYQNVSTAPTSVTKCNKPT